MKYIHIINTNPLTQSRALNKVVLTVIISVVLLLIAVIAVSQNNALVLNGGYVTLNGGTSGAPAYLVINQSNALGITRTSGHIISEGDYNFVKWNMGVTNNSYLYPFGYSTADYLPFTFNKTGGNANLAISTYYPTTNATANLPLANGVTDMQPSGPASDALNMVVDRWWRIKVENGATAPSGDLTFSYRGSENTISGISCPADVLTAQYWNGTIWVTPVLAPGSSCATAGIGTGQANGVSVFTTTSSQPFVLVKNTAPLPVELLYFNAFPKDNKIVRAEWTTATEINNDYFAVERSKEGIVFEQIGIVPGANNSSITLHYVFYDEHPYTGLSYYRLRQVDNDGQYSYSEIRAVYFGVFDLISIYPNPSDDFFFYLVASAEEGAIKVQAFDILGREILSQHEPIEKGVTAKKISTAQLSSGCYLLRVTSPKQERVQKQFIVK